MQHFCVACARRFAGAELGTLRELQLYGRAAHALERRSLTAPRDVSRDAEADAPSMVPLRRQPTAVPRRDYGPREGLLSSPKNTFYSSYITYPCLHASYCSGEVRCEVFGALRR